MQLQLKLNKHNIYRRKERKERERQTIECQLTPPNEDQSIKITLIKGLISKMHLNSWKTVTCISFVAVQEYGCMETMEIFEEFVRSKLEAFVGLF